MGPDSDCEVVLTFERHFEVETSPESDISDPDVEAPSSELTGSDILINPYNVVYPESKLIGTSKDDGEAPTIKKGVKPAVGDHERGRLPTTTATAAMARRQGEAAVRPPSNE